MAQETCPVCKTKSGQLKRHLKKYHGWGYTPESPNDPVPIEKDKKVVK